MEESLIVLALDRKDGTVQVIHNDLVARVNEETIAHSTWHGDERPS
jgi:hypothetical protein